MQSMHWLASVLIGIGDVQCIKWVPTTQINLLNWLNQSIADGLSGYSVTKQFSWSGPLNWASQDRICAFDVIVPLHLTKRASLHTNPIFWCFCT